MPIYTNPAAQQIAENWKKFFPNDAERLEKEGMLVSEAEAAADRWALALSQGLAKGLPYLSAAELADQTCYPPPG